MSSDPVLFTELIDDVLWGTNEFNRTAACSSSTNIDWFINALEEAGGRRGSFAATTTPCASVIQPQEHVLALAGSREDVWPEGRILSSRGWVFLVSGRTQQETAALVDLLDEQIEKVEGTPPSRS